MAGMTSALKAHLSSSFSPEALEALGSVASPLVARSYAPDGTFEADLLISVQTQRVTILRKGDAALTIIFRASGRHSFWDHDLRAYVDFARTPPPVRVQPPQSLLVESVSKETSVVVQIESTDDEDHETRHEFEFSTRSELRPFAASLFYLLHSGPRCHAVSTFPLEQLIQHGCIVRESIFKRTSKSASSALELDDMTVVDVDPSEFDPPTGYSPLASVLGLKKPEADRPQSDPPLAALAVPPTVTTDFALHPVPGPACFPSSSDGTITATIHQDLLDHALNDSTIPGPTAGTQAPRPSLVNAVAPFLGTASLNPNGTFTIPWLSALNAINTANSTAPGSGLYCFLQDAPRIPAGAPGGPSGGTGLLDRIAVKNLQTTDESGLTLLQREFIANTLPATLATWGIAAGSTAATDLIAASGDLWNDPGVTDADRIAIINGYENLGLGVVTIQAPNALQKPYTFSFLGIPLLTINVTNIEGGIDFSTLTGPLVSNASIGISGDIELSLALPNITLSGALSTSLDPIGWIVVNTPYVICVEFWILCPFIGILTLLLDFVLNNVAMITVSCTGVTIGLDIAYQFNAATNRVDPFVNLMSSSGSVTVLSFPDSPNIIAAFVDLIVTGVGDLFNAWSGLFAQSLAGGLQSGLQKSGVASLPPPQSGLQASGGMATSSANTLLTVQAFLTPEAALTPAVDLAPYVTQVDTSQVASDTIFMLHQLMRNSLPPSTDLLSLHLGVYAGFAIDQNALNYLLYSRWIGEQFSSVITDQPTIDALLSVAPAGAFTSPELIDQIIVFPVCPPRLEISMEGIVDGTRPLVVYFDDVRACFGVTIGTEQFLSLAELSFNLKTTGTLNLKWPSFAGFFFDVGDAVTPSDIRTWEFVDPAVLNVMADIRPNNVWLPLVRQLADQLLSAFSVPPTLVAPPSPPSWPRLLPAMQQEILTLWMPPKDSLVQSPQDFYAEILGRRRVLYVLTALRTTLLELVDGTWAPDIAAFFNPPQPRTVDQLSCSEGTVLQSLAAFMGDSTVFP
jgi:hypothetical protein